MQIIKYDNPTQLKNELIPFLRGDERKQVKAIDLVFREPVTLHYSNRTSNDVTSDKHTVKSLFFLDERGFANCMDREELEVDQICYVPPKKRSRGFSFWNTQLRHLEEVRVILATPQEQDYTKQWQAIANSMKKYGINPKVVEAIEDHLQGRTEHIQGFQNYWKRTDRPKTLSFADVVQQVTGYPEIESGRSYPHKEWMKIHSDHIKTVAIDRMKSRATKSDEKNLYAWYQTMRSGLKRDRSVSIQVYDDGRVDYHAASEYSGCGNGDYYIMYSPTMAFYAETD